MLISLKVNQLLIITVLMTRSDIQGNQEIEAVFRYRKSLVKFKIERFLAAIIFNTSSDTMS